MISDSFQNSLFYHIWNRVSKKGRLDTKTPYKQIFILENLLMSGISMYRLQFLVPNMEWFEKEMTQFWFRSFENFGGKIIWEGFSNPNFDLILYLAFSITPVRTLTMWALHHYMVHHLGERSVKTSDLSWI